MKWILKWSECKPMVDPYYQPSQMELERSIKYSFRWMTTQRNRLWLYRKWQKTLFSLYKDRIIYGEGLIELLKYLSLRALRKVSNPNLGITRKNFSNRKRFKFVKHKEMQQ